MAFTNEVIEEVISSSEEKPCCLKAEFAAFVYVAGYLKITKSSTSLALKVTKPVSARRVVTVGKKLFDFEVGPIIKTVSPFEKWFEVDFYSPHLIEELTRFGIVNPDFTLMEKLPKKILSRKCCQKSFLRGIFVTCGYVLHPGKGRHLELHFQGEETALFVSILMSKMGMSPHIAKRKHRYIVYLKSYDDVKAFLYHIGSKKASFLIEDMQTVREMKNDVNRLVNFEMANIGRIANSASRQLKAIKLIENTIGIDNLSPALREIAYLRLENPDASLEELSDLLGGKTKSAVSHRLRRLEKIAAKFNLEEKRKEES